MIQIHRMLLLITESQLTKLEQNYSNTSYVAINQTALLRQI